MTAAAYKPADPTSSTIWTDGVELLTSTGGKEREVRSLLGDLAKKHGRQKLADAIRETIASDPADPRNYVIGILRDKASRAAIGKSQLDSSEPAPVNCLECNDTKKIFVKDPDGQFDWQMIPKDCDKCS